MKRLTVLCIWALIILTSPGEAQNYTITDLGVLPGGTYTFPYDINDKGQVCGEADDTVTGDIHGFFYDPVKGIQDIGTLGGTFSNANGLNRLGQVVGVSTTSDGKDHAILWENGSMIDLGVLPGKIISIAYDINDAGKVVGASSMGWGWGNLQTFQAFVWDAIGGIQSLGLLPGGSWSAAMCINNSDHVVGETDTPGGLRGFLWSEGIMQDLGIPLGGTYSLATSINESGQIAGEGDTAGGETHAVVWTLLTPRQQIEILTTNVETFVTIGLLNQGQGNALTSKLEAVIAKLDQSNENVAINQLQAFINQIEALI